MLCGTFYVHSARDLCCASTAEKFESYDPMTARAWRFFGMSHAKDAERIYRRPYNPHVQFPAVHDDD